MLDSSTAATNLFGDSVLIADFNGDGFGDLAVSAGNQGKVYIFNSQGTSGISTQDDTTASSTITTGSGGRLATGDLNGDGYPDLIVAAPAYPGTFQGRVLTYHSQGSTGIPTQGVAGANANLTGESANDYFGDQIVAGDINSDGYDDVIVGAYYYNASSGVGRVYIYRSQGSSGIASGGAAAAASSILTGEAISWFGVSLALGDMNNDGRLDLVVGAPLYNSNFNGRVYIYYSQGSTGIPTQGAGSANVIFTGQAVNTDFGEALTLGDLNGDGYLDLIVGGWRYLATQTGRVWIFHSNADLFSSTTDASANTVIDGVSANDAFGFGLETADTDKDGYPDLIASAPTYNAGATQGRVYIFRSQGTSGIASQGAATAHTILTGEAVNERFSTLNTR